MATTSRQSLINSANAEYVPQPYQEDESDILRKKLELYKKIIVAESSKSMASYLGHVVIKSHPEPKPWGTIWEPWQREIVAPLVPAIESIAGLNPTYDGPRFFYYVLPKGHDKTGVIGRVCNWAIGFSKRQLRCVAAARDKDQAAFLLKSMIEEITLNSWLSDRIKHYNWWVDGKQFPHSRLTILPGDPEGASGETPDLQICDEITFWKNKDMYAAMFAATEKIPNSIFIVITNAGIEGTWQHEILVKARSNPRWRTYEAPRDTTLASWMDKKAIEEMARELPAGHANRVIWNRWVDGSEVGSEWPISYFNIDPSVSNNVGFDEWPRDLQWKIIALDPSKGKQKGDYSAFILMGVTEDGTMYIDANIERRDATKIVKDGMDLFSSFLLSNTACACVYGIESNGFQELLAPLMLKEAEERDMIMPNITPFVSTENKIERIRFGLSAPLGKRKFRFKRNSPGVDLLIEQLKDFPCGKHDDGPDALDMAYNLAQRAKAVGFNTNSSPYARART